MNNTATKSNPAEAASKSPSFAHTGFLPATSWILYDLANTGYYAIAVTFFLPEFIRKETGYLTPFLVTNAVALVLCAFLSPVIGALIDARSLSKALCIVATLICAVSVAAISLLPQDQVMWILVLYGVSMIMYQLAMVCYDALLGVVATPEKRGLVSGLGVGLGYGGTVLALGSIMVIFGENAGTDMRSLLVSGAFFLLFSLPLFAFVPERAAAGPPGGNSDMGLMASLRSLRRRPQLFWFLLGNFLFIDAVNAVLQIVVPFLRAAFGISSGEAQTILIVFALLAIPAGLIQGKLSDKLGAKPVMLASGFLFAAAVLAGALIPQTFTMVFLVILCTAGTLGLAGAWTAGRKWLLDLVDPAEAGTWFGLYGLTVKLSIVSSLLYGACADGLQAALFGSDAAGESAAYRWSTAILLALTAAGIGCLWKVKETPRG